jgi:hypothetical protein
MYGEKIQESSSQMSGEIWRMERDDELNITHNLILEKDFFEEGKVFCELHAFLQFPEIFIINIHSFVCCRIKSLIVSHEECKRGNEVLSFA